MDILLDIFVEEVYWTSVTRGIQRIDQSKEGRYRKVVPKRTARKKEEKKKNGFFSLRENPLVFLSTPSLYFFSFL